MKLLTYYITVFNKGFVFVVVVHIDGVRLFLWTVAINRPIFHPPDDIWVWRATVKWYWQGEPKNLEKNLFQSLCLSYHVVYDYIIQSPTTFMRTNGIYFSILVSFPLRDQCQCHFFHHKSHIYWFWHEPKPSLWVASDLTAWAMAWHNKTCNHVHIRLIFYMHP
jgi:hypothetical protein